MTSSELNNFEGIVRERELHINSRLVHLMHYLHFIIISQF